MLVLGGENMNENNKKQYHKVRYKSAPKKSSVSKFLASFFITLTIFLSVIAFFTVYYNVETLGFGRACEVFNIIDTESSIGFTLLDTDYYMDRSYLNQALALKDEYNNFLGFLKPAGIRLFDGFYDNCCEYIKDFVDENMDLEKVLIEQR